MNNFDSYVYKNQKKLKCGITTGSCAACAAYGAAVHLLLSEKNKEISLCTPKGITIEVPVFFVEEGEEKGIKYAEYMAIKDSGDDPDVTEGMEVHVRVYALEKEENITETRKVFSSEDYDKLFLDGGIGIGRVTKAGLEQEIGQAAINKVPRKMIFNAMQAVREKASYEGALKAVVIMPSGEELAKKTFNPKLGIEGGLSVLGTSGIIEPMSEKAIVDTIEAFIKQLSNNGEDTILVTPGNYGQGYVKEKLGLSLENGVKCSNYIGETIDLSVSYGMKHFILVGNIGKLVKLAAGIMNTHSRIADARGEIFGVHAAMCGADSDTVKRLVECINTDKMLEILEEKAIKEAVMKSIIDSIEKKMRQRIGDSMEFSVILFSEKYGYLGATENADTLLDILRGKEIM